MSVLSWIFMLLILGGQPTVSYGDMTFSARFHCTLDGGSGAVVISGPVHEVVPPPPVAHCPDCPPGGFYYYGQPVRKVLPQVPAPKPVGPVQPRIPRRVLGKAPISEPPKIVVRPVPKPVGPV